MFYAFVVLLSFAFIYYGHRLEVDAIKEVNKFKDLNKWIATNATIISSKTTYDLTYEYQVNGTDYFSKKYDLAVDLKDAYLFSRLKVGDTILCFCNPSSPSESVLKKEGINVTALRLGAGVILFCTPFNAAIGSSSQTLRNAGMVLSYSHVLCGILFLIYSSFGSYDSIGIAFSTYFYSCAVFLWGYIGLGVFVVILTLAGMEKYRGYDVMS